MRAWLLVLLAGCAAAVPPEPTPAPTPEPNRLPGDDDDSAEAPCEQEPAVLVDGGDALAVHVGTPPAWGDAVEVAVAVTNRCDAPLRFLGHPDDWTEGLALEPLPPVQVEAGATATFVLRLQPTDPGVVVGELVLPHDQPGSPLRIELEADVGPARRLVFVGDGRHVVTTHDYGDSIALDAWESLEAHGDELQRGVCWGDGRFVSVGGNDDRRWWTSEDGVAWTAHQAEGSPIGDCAFGDGWFVGFDGAPLRSADGLTWEAGQADWNPDHLRAVAFGDGVWVAVGDQGRVAVTDGQAWLHDGATEASGWTDVAFGDGFVAVGADGWVGWSADGVQWTTQQVGSDRWGGVVWGDGAFFAGTGSELHRSEDGLTWTLVNATPAVPRAATGRLLFATGAGALHRSDDGGFSWTELHAVGDGLGVSAAAIEGAE